MKTDRLRVNPRFAAALRPLACLTCAASLVVGVPTSVLAAAPVAAEAPASAEAPEAPASADAAEADAPDAVDAGDLSAGIEEAVAARKAQPSAATWRAEAQAHEAAGNYAAAAAAYRAELEALPADDVDARRRSEVDWERMRELSRGRVEDEPASTHRAELDGQWVPPAPAGLQGVAPTQSRPDAR